MKPVVYGMDESVYVRIVRLALEEKGVSYELQPIDPFVPGGPGKDYLERHPFGRIPAFEHDGFRLYEAGAIARYIDEAFAGEFLQPADPKLRARMNQIISVADSYVYRTLVWDFFVERVNKPQRNEASDEMKIAAALDRANICFEAISNLKTGGPWLCGAGLTLADLWLAPMIDYFLMTEEGRRVFEAHRDLGAWWQHLAGRQSMHRTAYPV